MIKKVESYQLLNTNQTIKKFGVLFKILNESKTYLKTNNLLLLGLDSKCEILIPKIIKFLYHFFILKTKLRIHYLFLPFFNSININSIKLTVF